MGHNATLSTKQGLLWTILDQRRRGCNGFVLLTGVLFSLTGFSPLEIIIAAQAANGFLLPLMAGILVYVTWKQEEFSLPRHYVLMGITIVVFCVLLGVRTLGWVWSQVGS